MPGGAGLRAGLAGVLAAAAVLLALGGPARGDEPLAAGSRDDRIAEGRALFARMGCGSCHRLAAGAGIGPIGPDLDAMLPSYDARALRAKISDPYPAGATGSFVRMPAYGGRLSDGELDALVEFLLSTTRD